MTERYSRQEQFEGIGKDGQERLGRGTAVVVGIGALGAVSAGQLVRAGVGRVLLVDRDFIELHNLQRQPLYDEEDVRQGLPKAIAAQRKLQAANAEVVVEAMVTDLVPANIVPLLTVYSWGPIGPDPLAFVTFSPQDTIIPCSAADLRVSLISAQDKVIGGRPGLSCPHINDIGQCDPAAFRGFQVIRADAERILVNPHTWHGNRCGNSRKPMVPSCQRGVISSGSVRER